ncbi:ABC transporter substrate-binding protein [Metabacillus fastidiosus]|uniref:ABC transporter substrate-binding protein n=1 Tax=Metabacillus fastidiosus TaxID=1458 RepID=UPI003D295901
MKQMKQWLLPLLAAALFFSLAACGTKEEEKQSADNEKPKTEEVQKEAYPLTLKDGLGNEVTIEAKPEKIVSLIPSNTEVTYALGMGDAVVGVNDFDNYPEEVKDVEKIGGMEFNVEKIVSLKPDVVLADVSNDKAGLQQLKDAGLTVVAVPAASSFDAVYDSIRFLGKVTGTTEEADKIVEDMQKDLAVIKEKAETIKEEDKKKVFAEVSPAPDIYTAGKGSFMDEMITVIGAKNVVDVAEPWPSFTEEKAVALKPDTIILTYGYYTENAVEQVLARKAWQDVPAVKNKQVFDIHSDKVVRPGPRLIEGVEELAKAVYPDVYK